MATRVDDYKKNSGVHLTPPPCLRLFHAFVPVPVPIINHYIIKNSTTLVYAFRAPPRREGAEILIVVGWQRQARHDFGGVALQLVERKRRAHHKFDTLAPLLMRTRDAEKFELGNGASEARLQLP
jgi:hypothetical protein